MERVPTLTENSKIRFWGILAIMILAVAITVTLVDLTIKAAILQESNSLRLLIERETNAKGTERSDDSGIAADASDDSTVPGDVLAIKPVRLETRNVSRRRATRPKIGPDTGRDDVS